MRTRIVVGLVGLPFALVPIWLGGIWSAGFFLLVALIGGLEFYHLLDRYHPSLWLGLIWLATLVLHGWLPERFPLPLLLIAGLILTFVDAIFRKDHPIETWLATCIGAIYLGVMLGQSLAIRQLPDGRWWLMFGLFVTWFNDTAAFFVGVTFGRHRFWPRLSPKKTWEGTVAGWITAALFGAVFVQFAPVDYSILHGAVFGVLCGILALFGDLSISMLKRQAGVKDSGRFFPGHGGMLDRLDSILFVLPFVYSVVVFWH